MRYVCHKTPHRPHNIWFLSFPIMLHEESQRMRRSHSYVDICNCVPRRVLPRSNVTTWKKYACYACPSKKDARATYGFCRFRSYCARSLADATQPLQVITTSNKALHTMTFVVRPNAIERMIMQTIILTPRKTDQYHPSKNNAITFSEQN